MTNKNEFEHDVRIDPHRLDDAWVEQPSLYSKYARQLADATKYLEECKGDLEVVKAELYQDISSKPEHFGLKKTTETAINAVVMLQPLRIDRQKAVIEARHVVDILKAGVQALDHRKQALEGLVKLFLNDYYSSPRAPEEAKEKMDHIERRARPSGVRPEKRRKE